MRFILAGLFLFSSLAFSQNEGGGFAVLPMANFNGDQGLGVGGEFVWSKMSGTEWSMRAGGFHSFNFVTSVLGISLQNKKFMDRLYANVSLSSLRTEKSLFYGYGSFTSLVGPSQYSMQSLSYEIKLGYNVTDQIVAGLGYGVSQVAVRRGSREDSVQYVDRYSDRPFVNGSDQRLLKLFAMYDDQDSEFAPESGTKAIFQYEMGHESRPEISKLMGSAVHIFQITGDTLLGVARARFQRTWGGDNPFYSQSRLGGRDTLRGYKNGRWTDSASVLYGAEARWKFWQIGGWLQRMELSFAYETGRVFNNGAINVLWDELRPNQVIGLTGVLSSGIPVRLDVAQSPEGYEFYFHLLYPF